MAGRQPPAAAPLLLATLLLLPGTLAGPVVVDQKVSAILGKNVTLKCLVTVTETVTQISWEKQDHGTSDTVAVYHPHFGVSIQGNYVGRADFTNPSLKDATILIKRVQFSDSGNYICKVVTFPLGNYQETSIVTVIVEPTITVGGGPEPLVDGANETVAAVCTAANGKPAASVFWETDLIGEKEQTKISAPNETVTVVNRFKIVPSRFVRKRPITCIVIHPSFNTTVRVPYVLDVQYAPEVTVLGYDGNWFVGRQNVQLKCKADANPSPSAYIWTRLEKPLPENLQIENDTLTFNRPLNYNDSGIYICDVVNIHGQRKNQKVVQIRDPPTTTLLSTTLPPIHSTVGITNVPAFTKRSLIPQSTLESVKSDSLGTIIGGVVGGTLFLMLVVIIIVMFYLRRRRTFRGDYYTKQYAGTTDIQKDSQMDVLQSNRIEPYTDYEKSERKLEPNNIFQDYPIEVQKSKWQSADNINNRYTEGVELPVDYYEDRKISNAPPYLHDDYYDENEDDLISHLDGSIISRREWYV
ncbi:nectin-3-like isoform X1 [Hemiscyllium ocellatum]|uniref:nectin-3-like isoform X1 n=1 Tax=Hemiscyllium ocellatum TaxID=170820 RepID=UPI0029660B40|nr:nectin-3-like isoform X1 [Hemiscyllium ocellatum]